MAYADTQNPRRRTVAMGAAALVQGAAIYALVTGLSFVQLVETVVPITARNIPMDPPDATPPPPRPEPKAQADTSQIDRVVRPIEVNIGQPVLPALPEIDRMADGGDFGFPTGGGAGTIPSPTPSFTPTLARPRGNPGQWVSPLDYPASELRAEHQGVSRVRALIGIDGRVKDCSVVASTGFPLLDQTACRKLADRARFEPATDSSGARVEGSYTATIRWVIPQ